MRRRKKVEERRSKERRDRIGEEGVGGRRREVEKEKEEREGRGERLRRKRRRGREKNRRKEVDKEN